MECSETGCFSVCKAVTGKCDTPGSLSCWTNRIDLKKQFSRPARKVRLKVCYKGRKMISQIRDMKGLKNTKDSEGSYYNIAHPKIRE